MTTAGQFERFTVVFNDGQGDVGDPTSVAFAYKVGNINHVVFFDGVSSDPGNIVHDGEGTGAYHIDMDTTTRFGEWTWFWASQGEYQFTTDPQTFTVDPPLIPINWP